MKKKAGWVLFGSGIGIFVANLAYMITWNQWLSLIWPWLLVWFGWSLAHPKSKEDIKKKQKEEEEGVL